MKIATYNIWNDEATLELRAKQILEEIRAVDADVIGLQEVSAEFYNKYLREESGYKYHAFVQHPGEEEGLIILCRYPIIAEAVRLGKQEPGYAAVIVHFSVDGMRFSLTNVHLPWNSVHAREQYILELNQYLCTLEDDFHILLGDFNSGIGSSVNQYLCGDRTLDGCEANPPWNDLARAYAARIGETVKPTLDTVHNPRWAGKKSIYAPQVMDRIYIMDHWHETELESVKLFGTEVSVETGYAASDHYGVVAEVNFRK